MLVLPRLSRLLLILSFLLLALPAAAGVGIWTPLGPDGGSVWALAVDPADPDVVYAGTTNGMFKSTDGGETWTAISRGLGPEGVWVRAILVRPGAVYIGTEAHGAFKSTDGGATWFRLSGIPPVHPGSGPSVGALLADPRNPNRIWAGARRGLLSTTNGGATWTNRFQADPFDAPVTGIAIDPVNGQIFVSISRRGVYTSTNEGRRWTKVSRNLNASSYHDLVIDPNNRSVLHVGTGSGLWRSDNRGASWRRVPALGDRGVLALAYQGNRLYAASLTLGIFYSDDQGRIWTPTGEKPEDPQIVELAAGPDALYVGTAGNVFLGTAGNVSVGGVFRSLDQGATWEPGSGMDSLRVDLVAVDPSDPDVLYAVVPTATFSQWALFKSMDRGETWEVLDLGLDLPNFGPGLRTLLVDPSDPSTLYADFGHSILRSRDAGATWEAIALPLYIQELEADPRAPGAVWAAGFLDILPGTSPLYHSDDFGATWEPVAFPLPQGMEIRAFEVDPTNPQVLWAGGSFLEVLPNSFRVHLRVFRSGDGGQTWQRRDTGLPTTPTRGGLTVLDLAIDPANPSRVYAATESGLYRTTDAGLTWARVPGFTAPVTEVEAAPATPSAIYAYLSGFGIQRSTDGGATWSAARRGLAPIPVLDLVVDPTDPRRLYAGTLTRGVFTYTEPGN